MLAGVLSAAFGAASAGSSVWEDHFAAPRDRRFWSTYDWGGPTEVQAGGRVVMSLPGDSQGDSFVAGYQGHYVARGDFDIQIDYALPTWPVGSGVRVGLTATSLDRTSTVNVVRIGVGASEPEGPADVYATHLLDGVFGVTPTEDRSGRLRLVRESDVYSGYYLDGETDEWVLLHSGPGPEGDVFFGFSAWSHDPYFGDEAAQVTFDNYRLEADRIWISVNPIGMERPMAALAPDGETAPLPRRSFKVGRTLPLRLKLIAGGGPPLAGDEVSAPEIVALFRGGVKLDLSKLDLAGGKPGYDLHFRSAGRKWTYTLSTASLTPGTYSLVIEMPDDLRYSARFKLRQQRGG
jgi:hypothetical protein